MTEQQYIASLAREYLDLCALMTDGLHSAAEVAALETQRAGVHDELFRVLGDQYVLPSAMQAYCKRLLEDV